MAMVHQNESFLLNLDRLLHHLVLGIEFAQAEVVCSEFRGQDQLNILQIGCRALQAGVGGLQSLPGSTEQIDFVVQSEGNLVHTLRQRGLRSRTLGTIAGVPVARCAGIGAERGNSPADATRASERA